MQTGNRLTVRVRGHDYAGRATYFVTLVTENRECLFGQVIDGKMYLNELGHIVREEWLRSPQIRSELDLDRWIVMPNHLHGIVCFMTDRDPQWQGAPPRAPTTSMKTSTSCRLQGRCRGDRSVALPSENRPNGLPAKSLGSFIAGFKLMTTIRINKVRGTPGIPVWQRNYDEHIIDNDAELQRVRRYIEDNPRNWDPNEGL